MVRVTVGTETREYAYGTTFLEIAKDFRDKYDSDILMVSVNGRLRELHRKLEKESELVFLTARDKAGINAYRRSVLFILLKAWYDVYGKDEVNALVSCFTMGSGLYIERIDGRSVTQEELDRVYTRMREITEEKVVIYKRSLGTEDAIEMFGRHGMEDKERLFRFRTASSVNVYSIENYDNYFYGYMVPDTGYIRVYSLELFDRGFILNSPKREDPTFLPPINESRKLFDTQLSSEKWSRALGIADVGSLNQAIADGKTRDIILMQEALQEKQIGDIAETIVKSGRKIVMIAGPSSSGKTTFSHRLSIQLAALGMKPHPVEADNYFVNREDTPKDEKGDYDFESLGAIDVKQFNKDMLGLLNGEKVEIPRFNFVSGRREYKGDYLTLGQDDVLIIEGIHCLNEKMSYALPADKKFRVYISALTQLNIDNHDRIPTTDGRLIRRMIRDARRRGTSARETIRRWDSVRRGEERNIFPNQETADVMFNSALVYELAVLKQFAEPLLMNIPRDCEEYQEAKRLLKFLSYFLGVSSEWVPTNSLLREFVGGGVFNV